MSTQFIGMFINDITGIFGETSVFVAKTILVLNVPVYITGTRLYSTILIVMIYMVIFA